MSETFDLPVALAAAPFDPEGKTVDEVVTHVERALRQTENEPEWVSSANFVNDANTDLWLVGKRKLAGNMFDEAHEPLDRTWKFGRLDYPRRCR
ncbi:hypothetical protein [Paraburkholderia sp. XV]|uniref:hypothetical protein n=1 Tax=Paraburkholderia sp. XV TaxID=2831520 RepID=UPI001CD536BD|nr:hypothetical protein [Paraburkholderia sp. XV]